jgi:hypothetical protein
MNWSYLPEELIPVILANLSLFELARISCTCRGFKAVYGRLMAAEQKSRRDLAVKSFGGKRIACLLALITHLLGREIPGADSGKEGRKEGWISEDGELQDLRPCDFSRNLVISFSLYLNCSPDRTTVVLVIPHKSQWPGLLVDISCDRNNVSLRLSPASDGDLEMVAVVQALLSDGLAEFIRNSKKGAEIRVLMGSKRCTRAGLKAQIFPLLPFASSFTCMPRGTGSGDLIEERMHIGPVRSDAD